MSISKEQRHSLLTGVTQKRKREAKRKDVSRAEHLRRKILSGEISPEDLTEAERKVLSKHSKSKRK